MVIETVLLAAAATVNAQRIDLEIPKYCVQEITLVDCDMNKEPPKCKGSIVKYQSECAIIHIVREKNAETVLGNQEKRNEERKVKEGSGTDSSRDVQQNPQSPSSNPQQ